MNLEHSHPFLDNVAQSLIYRTQPADFTDRTAEMSVKTANPLTISLPAATCAGRPATAA